MFLRRWVWLSCRVHARVGLVVQQCSCAGGSSRVTMSQLATLFGSVGEFDSSREDWMRYASAWLISLLLLRSLIKTERKYFF